MLAIAGKSSVSWFISFRVWCLKTSDFACMVHQKSCKTAPKMCLFFAKLAFRTGFTHSHILTGFSKWRYKIHIWKLKLVKPVLVPNFWKDINIFLNFLECFCFCLLISSRKLMSTKLIRQITNYSSRVRHRWIIATPNISMWKNCLQIGL